MVGTILLIGGLALVAFLAVEYGLYRRAKKRADDGTLDSATLPILFLGSDHFGGHHGEDRIGDEGAMDHIDPSDHPGV